MGAVVGMDFRIDQVMEMSAADLNWNVAGALGTLTFDPVWPYAEAWAFVRDMQDWARSSLSRRVAFPLFLRVVTSRRLQLDFPPHALPVYVTPIDFARAVVLTAAGEKLESTKET